MCNPAFSRKVGVANGLGPGLFQCHASSKMQISAALVSRAQLSATVAQA